MLTAEPRLIRDTLFFRLSGGAGPVRTEPTGIAVLTLRHELDRLIVERVRHQQAAKDTEKAIRQAIADGVLTLRLAAMQLLSDGITTASEVIQSTDG